MRLTFTALAALGTAACPVIAVATDYLSVGQAQKLMFPEASSFQPQTLTFDSTRTKALEKLSGLSSRSNHWQVLVARKGEQVLGYVVVDNVLGKFELITYAVALGIDGTVRQVEILSYRESHGYEVRLPAWRKQFVGKSIQSPLRIGSDIANISGATLSCSHITDGIRQIVSLIKIAKESSLLI
jgi:Na+-translocating ferredoxin:NAD+ oxidoreductase RnfG subunit